MNTFRFYPIYSLALLILGNFNVFAQLQPAEFRLPETLSFPFEWKTDTTDNSLTPLQAMLIPVNLPGFTQQLYLQFDTGSPATLFYSTAIQQLSDSLPDVFPAPDSSGYFTRFDLILGNSVVGIFHSSILPFGSAIKKQDTLKVIGTFGRDLMKDKSVVIDFPNRRITLYTKSLPKPYRHIAYHAFRSSAFGILLPGFTDSLKGDFLWDSGSSAYALITDSMHFHTLRDSEAAIQTKTITSWGRPLQVHTCVSSARFSIAGCHLPLPTVTYITGASEQQQHYMRQSGMNGMLGNGLLTKCVLILDFPRQLFGIKTTP